MNFDVTAYPDGSVKIDFGTFKLVLEDESRTELRSALLRPCVQGVSRTTGPFEAIYVPSTA
jgi:hypothetical protein